jgi:hypothetical protein
MTRFEVKGTANTPSLRKMRGAIEKWAAAQGEGEAGSPPNKTFTIDDWQIEPFLFSGFKISPAAEIREAAATKGSASQESP